ncbi:MAG TPA: hypothetical protein VLC46_11795 [Thermoanaerobaculia bacterium]|nr:hypothetical protein [Thermoanaerobaculia bacterium]
MQNTTDTTELTNRRIDYWVATLKAAAGTVPLFGSLVAEAVGVAIPQQRIDRMADVIRKLAERLDSLNVEIDQIRERFRSAEFTDIFEESMLQAGKALSTERREHIANILANGLTERELHHERTKKLLLLLADLTDPEVILLSYANVHRSQKNELFARYGNILREPGVKSGAPLEVREERALQESWRRHLVQLGLTTVEHASVNDVTALGRMLLRYISAPPSTAA